MGDAIKQLARPSPVAMAYAHSLLELANEQKQAEPIAAELAQLGKIVSDNASSREVLVNPAIGVEEREEIVERIFKNNVSQLLFDTLRVMNRHNRLGIIAEVAAAYNELYKKQLGKVEVDLIVAHKLDMGQLEAARVKISQALGKDAMVEQHVDEDIIGGVVVKVGDRLIDASVRSQLNAMKEQLLASAPK